MGKLQNSGLWQGNSIVLSIQYFMKNLGVCVTLKFEGRYITNRELVNGFGWPNYTINNSLVLYLTCMKSRIPQYSLFALQVKSRHGIIEYINLHTFEILLKPWMIDT